MLKYLIKHIDNMHKEIGISANTHKLLQRARWKNLEMKNTVSEIKNSTSADGTP